MPRVVKRPILQGVSHGLSCYRKGCGCSVGRAAKSQQRQQEIKRAAARALAAAQGGGTVPAAEPVDAATAGDRPADLSTAPASAPQRTAGPVEQSVIEDFQQLDGVPMQASLRAVALALAREIDDNAGPSVAGAARQLVTTLAEIRKASDQNDDQLAALLASFGSPIGA